MEEKILWSKRPSLIKSIPRTIVYIIPVTVIFFIPEKYLSVFIYHSFSIFNVLFILASVLIFAAFFKLFNAWSNYYQLTTERLFIYSGIFNRTREEIELYRIRDYKVLSPFFLRIFGLSNILICSTDRLAADIILYAIKDSYNVANLIRNQVELQRQHKGFLEFNQKM